MELYSTKDDRSETRVIVDQDKVIAVAQFVGSGVNARLVHPPEPLEEYGVNADWQRHGDAAARRQLDVIEAAAV